MIGEIEERILSQSIRAANRREHRTKDCRGARSILGGVGGGGVHSR